MDGKSVWRVRHCRSGAPLGLPGDSVSASRFEEKIIRPNVTKERSALEITARFSLCAVADTHVVFFHYCTDGE